MTPKELELPLAIEAMVDIYRRGLETHPDTPKNMDAVVGSMMDRGDNLHRGAVHLHEYLAGREVDEHGMSTLKKSAFRLLVEIEAGEKREDQTIQPSGEISDSGTVRSKPEFPRDSRAIERRVQDEPYCRCRQLAATDP